MQKLKTLLLSTSILLLFCLFYSPSFCHSAEKSYVVTETQLTALETNSTELKQKNKELQTQLQNSRTQVQSLQTQSKMLQTQVSNLTKSLANVKALLTKYENSQQNKEYAAGLGVSKNGIAINADINKVWMFADRDTFAVGYKLKF